MKRLSILLATAALFAITGCQKEPVGKENASEADVYVQFTINFADGVSTKADYQDGFYAIGTDQEHAVKHAYIYFFNSETDDYVSTVAIAAGDITSANIAGRVVKKTTVPTKLNPAKYDVYATINYEVTELTGKKISDFQQKVYTHNYASFKIDENGIPMSSRSSDGTLCQADVVVDSWNTKDNPVQISLYMERMLAKLTVKTTTDAYVVTPEHDSTGLPLATVKLTDYKEVNLPTQAYLYRHVGTDAGTTTFGEVTASNYVIEPETAYKNNGLITGLHYYNHVNASDAFTAMPAVDEFTTPMYCTENTMLKDAQYKTYATAYAFKAKITPAEGRFYKIGSTEGSAPGNAPESVEALWYFDGYFYENLATLNAVRGLSLSDDSSANNYYGKFGVKKYKEGVCYYTYYIRHFDNSKAQEMGIMEFAIVRNNDYQVRINRIAALGEDVPTVLVEQIEATQSYFQATLLVRPWVVRDQDAVLG